MLNRKFIGHLAVAATSPLQQNHPEPAHFRASPGIKRNVGELVSIASDALCVIDQSGKAIQFNDSFARMLGYSNES